ncbi:NAD(P)-binding protein [Mollisia scopiformis]|uniref:NAD(P)-binding protein n=1 Tax=Mollisia scopiformis TaxID=149040 RepID=A0A194XT13_MOLSC|nr:NAD(P)-binding protein [Mollisia scopiformis]KUJ23338.1 NAD(P)-binding protein [Mollisia scopiformis]
MDKNVAIITGGASGMGFAVATSLSKKGWRVTIADKNMQAGKIAARELSCSFFETDVCDFASLSTLFDQVFGKEGRINFVFANAGIGEHKSFYAQADGVSGPPAELDTVIDVDLKGVINTTYLAQHYFRKVPKGTKNCLILNASIAGIYPAHYCPIYTAAKHGIVGFARAISTRFYNNDGIRVNALCPGSVRTNIFEKHEWDHFDNGFIEFIELAQIVKIVELILFDESMQGQVVEVAPKDHYLIKRLEYNDSNVAHTLDETAAASLSQ